jgi:hypothetical protein
MLNCQVITAPLEKPQAYTRSMSTAPPTANQLMIASTKARSTVGTCVSPTRGVCQRVFPASGSNNAFGQMITNCPIMDCQCCTIRAPS